MPIESMLTHRVSLVRKVAVLDDEGDPATDEFGQAIVVEDAEPGIAVAIQPKTAREVAAFHGAGAAISTHTIFAVHRGITTADAIAHEPDACPMPAAQDLPRGRYELVGIPDAAGVGHHMELDAVLVASPTASLPEEGGSGGSGSGSGSGS
jgi:hypothetical protein